MPANKMNWLVVYKGESQVYGTATKAIALETPPPVGQSIKDKMVLFVTYEPDGQVLSVRPLPQEEVVNATLKMPTKKKKEDE